LEKAGVGAALAPFLLCLPCLLVALAAAGGVALASSAVAWLADEPVIATLGIIAALLAGSAVRVYRRQCSARKKVN